MRDIQTYRENPLSFFDDMRENVRSFFEDFPVWSTAARSPAVDVREEDEQYVVEAELPGMTEEDVQVDVDEDTLTIASKRQEQSEEKKEGYLRRERRTTAFRRSFALPPDVEESKIDAAFKNGLLTVTLPKGKESTRRRTISIRPE
jgi:HSP20 family protein